MKPHPRLPSREELLAFIRERSGKVGTREIARAFGAKNADRAALKRMLRELADDGSIERRRKRLHHAGTLPPVVLADITGRDSRRRTDGAADRMGRGGARRAADHPHHHAAPRPARRSRRRRRPRAPAHRADQRRAKPAAASSRSIDRAKHRMLGIFRSAAGGGGRLVPIDKKQLGRELAHPAGATAGAGRRSRRGRGRAAAAGSACRPHASSSGSARSRANAR